MTGDSAVAVERQPPDAAFGLLASDVRVRIVQALGEAGDRLSFSALREAVAVADSGKFNYHLKRLTGHFVARTDDGYRLSLAGQRVYGAIQSGAYTVDATLDPIEFEGPCPICAHETLVAAYADEQATLSCPACEAWRNEFSFPPATLDQFATADLPMAFDRWMAATVGKVVRGFCANCGGRVDGRLVVADERAPQPARVRYDCERCGDSLTASPFLPALSDPVAVAFFHRHGVDVAADPSWRYLSPEMTLAVDLSGTDPVEATVTVTTPDESLLATLGPDATPTVTTR